MKNFKIGLNVFLLLFILGCQSNDQNIDETPAFVELEPQPSRPGEEFLDVDHEGNPHTPLVSMEISVEFPDEFDRQSFRNEVGIWFGLEAFWTCFPNSNLEIWKIPELTNAQLDAIIQSLIDSDPDFQQPPGTASSGIKVRVGDPFARDNVYKTVLLYYYNNCH